MTIENSPEYRSELEPDPQTLPLKPHQALYFIARQIDEQTAPNDTTEERLLIVEQQLREKQQACGHLEIKQGMVACPNCGSLTGEAHDQIIDNWASRASITFDVAGVDLSWITEVEDDQNQASWVERVDYLLSICSQ